MPTLKTGLGIRGGLNFGLDIKVVLVLKGIFSKFENGFDIEGLLKISFNSLWMPLFII